MITHAFKSSDAVSCQDYTVGRRKWQKYCITNWVSKGPQLLLLVGLRAALEKITVSGVSNAKIFVLFL